MYRRNVPPAIIRDGNTVAWWDFSDPTAMILDGSNNCSVVFDKSVDARFGSTLNSGNLVSGKAYKIISQGSANYFATGKIAGDVFIASTTTALDANNTVQLVQGNPLLQATLANQPHYYATQTFGSALTTGNLVVGRTYQVLTTTTDYFGSGVVVGNLFVASSTLALSGSNSVREEVSKGKELVFDGVDDVMKTFTQIIGQGAHSVYINYCSKIKTGTNNYPALLSQYQLNNRSIAFVGSPFPNNEARCAIDLFSNVIAKCNNTYTPNKNNTTIFKYNSYSTIRTDGLTKIIHNGINQTLTLSSTNPAGTLLGSVTAVGKWNDAAINGTPNYLGGIKEIIVRAFYDTDADTSYFEQYYKSKHQIIY